MITATAERQGTKTVDGTLEAIDFQTISEPIFDGNGRMIDGYQQLRRQDTGHTLSIMSDQYKLIQHKEAIFPAVELLGKDGWEIKASRVQRHGASAFVELVRRDRTVTVVGQKVGERILMRNTYDGSSQLTFMVGGIVLVCSNGMIVPQVGAEFSTRHVGEVHERLEFIHSRVRSIEQGLASRMIESYSQFDKEVPVEIGKEVIKRIMGERKIDECFQLWQRGIGRSGDRTAWDLYNGITQYLTHDFTGSWELREQKNQRSLGLITDYLREGRLPKISGEQN